MSTARPCLLAGLCCFIHLFLTAQPDWPLRQAILDSSIIHLLPTEELRNYPPPIFYASHPTELVLIEGNHPIITVDEKLRMYRLVNTPHLIIKNHHDNRFYLYAGRYWYVSDSSAWNFRQLRTYPEVIRLMDSLVKKEERNSAVFVKSTSAKRPPVPLTAPKLIVTPEPAELIQTRGKPVYKTIPGSSLTYISNTENDIFRDSSNQQFYLLLSGRWYTSDSLAGTWTYLSGEGLPSSFLSLEAIPGKARVLTHVPGTDSARKAFNHTLLLQTTRIPRKPAELNLVYDGGAEFSSLSNTGLFISENSNIPVVNFRDSYFALYEGAWFRSSDATGPWQPSTERPPEIDRIPSSHRLYHSRFVYIYDSTEQYVFTGYTGSYKNSFIQNNTIVWGSGWDYKAWYRRLYFQRQSTWGQGTYYTNLSGWKARPGLPLYPIVKPPKEQ